MQTAENIEKKHQALVQKLRLANCTMVLFEYEDFDVSKVRHLDLYTAQNTYIKDKELRAEVQSLMDDLVAVKHGGYATGKHGQITWIVSQASQLEGDKGAIFATLGTKKVVDEEIQSHGWPF